jgi:hypothetical protein
MRKKDDTTNILQVKIKKKIKKVAEVERPQP